MTQHEGKQRGFVAAVALTLLTSSIPRSAEAAEGGASSYLQGTYNDFGMALVGDKGVYGRSDVFYYPARVSARPLGGRINVGVQQRLWLDLKKLALVTDWKIFGATVSAAVAIPIVLNVDASLSVATATREGFVSGSTGGLGDIYVIPLQLNWKWGNHYLAVAEGIYTPTGAYDEDRLLNVGRNYAAFDSTLTYTWQHAERGHELSVATGYLVNLKNPTTGYRTGSELHVDWLLGQHLPLGFGLGLTGYWYHQVTGDRSDEAFPAGLDPASFRGRGVGLGAAAMASPKPFGKEVNVIAKWLHDVHTTKRFDGNIFMLSVALKLL